MSELKFTAVELLRIGSVIQDSNLPKEQSQEIYDKIESYLQDLLNGYNDAVREHRQLVGEAKELTNTTLSQDIKAIRS
jgi:hypothetical protein